MGGGVEEGGKGASLFVVIKEIFDTHTPYRVKGKTYVVSLKKC